MSEETNPAKVTPEADTAPGSDGAPPSATPPPAEPTPTPTESDPVVVPDPPADGTPKEPEAAPPERIVPESYDLKLVDGSYLNDTDIKRVEDYSKEHKLTQEESVKVLGHDHTVVDEYVTRKVKELQDESKVWEETIKADKVIGLQNHSESMALQDRFLEAHAPEGFMEKFKKSQLSKEPDLVRMLVHAGREMAEGSFVKGGKVPHDNKKTKAQMIYPKHSSKEESK